MIETKIEEAQLDAWRHGMSDAAIIVRNSYRGDIPTDAHDEWSATALVEIQQARDARKEI